MSRRERLTPYEKEQACLDYISGNRYIFPQGRFKIGLLSIKNMGF